MKMWRVCQVCVCVCVYWQATVGTQNVWTCPRPTLGPRTVLTWLCRRWRHQSWRQHLFHQAALAWPDSRPTGVQQPCCW